MLLKFFTNRIGYYLAYKEVKGELNLLDIGCANFVPEHFCRYDKYINYVGCDPDPIGLSRTKKFLRSRNFKNENIFNVGASDKSGSGFLLIPEKRTGSKVVNKKTNETKDIKLIETCELQEKFSNGSANIIKIDCEGNEVKVIKGLNLDDKSLLCVEIECTLINSKKNNLGELIDSFEKKGFFVATIRYHNEQTIYDKTIKNKFLRRIFIFLGIIGIVGKLESWTNLSGKLDFNLNKSFLTQLEIVFLKNKDIIPDDLIKKYYNCLLIYGFLRYVPKVNKLIFPIKSIIKLIPSR